MKLAEAKIRKAKPVRPRSAKGRAPSSEPPRRPPPPEGAPAGLVKWTLGVIGLGALLMLGALLAFYPNADGPGQGALVEFDAVAGTSADDLAEALAARGTVGNKLLFALYLRARGGTSAVIAGHHLLSDALSPRELISRLERHGQSKVRVTFPEGWTRFDMAKRLETARVCTLRAFLDASTDAALLRELAIEGASADGYLFPATYELEADADARDVIRVMVREFERRYAQLQDKHASGMKDLGDSLGWGRKQIVTLASMIEKEAVVDDERPVVASVFVNRLRDPGFSPKLLQCDPTAGYGCTLDPSTPGCRSYSGKITHEVVADEQNMYNTYKHTGLPPGPIANPGEKSLGAAMSPALTRYFYFVAKGGGRHTFSESYTGHTSAVQRGRDAAP